MTKNITKTTNNKIAIPRWLVIILPALVAIIGIYSIYNAFAVKDISTSYSTVTNEASAVYIYCENSTDCYNKPLLTTAKTEALVRNTQDANCTSGYQWTSELRGESTVWRCVLVVGD